MIGQADINLVGDFLSSGSFSMLSRTLATTLSLELGLSVKLMQKSLSKVLLEKESYFQQQLQLSNVLQPSIITIHITNPPFQPINNSLNILYNLHNTVDFNTQMLKAHEYFQYVFLNSYKQAEEMNKVSKYKKYIHVPYSVDLNFMNSSVKKCKIVNVTDDIFLNEKIKPFIFYAEGCLHSRNSFEELIRGYCSAFSERDNVVLMLKVLNTSRDHNDNDYTKNQLTEIKNKIKSKNLPNIYLINEALSDVEYFNLLNNIDCFVNISKWDSLFSGLSHAIILNKEIITPNYNSYCDLANDSIAITMNCNKENQYNSFDRFYEDGDTWFETSSKEYKSAMRKVYEIHIKGGEGFKKRAKARESLAKNIDSKFLCKNMLNLCLTVLKEHHSNNNVFKSIASKIEKQKDNPKFSLVK